MSQDNYPTEAISPEPKRKRRNPWQWFKSLGIIKKVLTVGAAFIALLIILPVFASIVDPDGFEESQEQVAQDREDREAEAEREAEEEAEREAEEERLAEEEAEAEREAEEQRQQEEEEEAAEQEAAESSTEEEEAEAAEEEPAEEESEAPEGIEGQIALMTDLRGFEDAEVFLFEGDESYQIQSVNAHVEVEPGWSETSMCRNAREQTIRGLQFMRDDVTEDYDEVMFSFTAEGQADATGESSTLGMASIFYDYETVQAIDDDAVTISNVWEASDSGSEGVVCQRADDI